MDYVWQNYLKTKLLADVTRSGFVLCGVCDTLEDASSGRRVVGESVLEHMGGLCSLLTEVMMDYEIYEQKPLFYHYSPIVVLKVAQLHDIAEVEVGDIPDDGSVEHDLKKAREMELVREYVANLPAEFVRDVWDLYVEFTEHKKHDGQVMYMADKLEAVLQLLVYESKGMYGDVYLKSPPSKNDVEFAKIVGTGNCTDVWAYHFWRIVQHFPMDVVTPFVGILNEAVYDVRGEMFSWWR